MSSVTEVAVPTSDFDGNAPANEAGAGMVSDEIDALMRDVEALSGDDAVFSMLRHPSVSGGDEWWNW